MLRTRSTSPPKSACPGVSTMLILMPPYVTAAFLARIVMPRSRSWSFESMIRSSCGRAAAPAAAARLTRVPPSLMRPMRALAAHAPCRSPCPSP
eukprot:2062690-Prymnesium_polylepis.1